MKDQSIGIEKLYTISEAAKILRLSKSQLYLLVQQRKIPYIRLTERRLVLKESDLMKWLEERQVEIKAIGDVWYTPGW